MNESYLCDFLAQKKAEGYRLDMVAWRKLIRRLAVERKHEKRLNRDLCAIGADDGNNAPTKLKFKIMFLEDFRRSMYGQRIGQRVHAGTYHRPNLVPIDKLTQKSILEYIATKLSSKWDYDVFRRVGWKEEPFLVPNLAVKTFPGMAPHKGWDQHWGYAEELGIMSKEGG